MPANYMVRHVRWPDYDTMNGLKPVHDGGPPQDYKVKFLNRTVHIVVENNACWQSVLRT